LYFRPAPLGTAVLEKQRRLFVVVKGDEIVVTSDTGFRATYCRRPNRPQLIIRRRTDTDDNEVLAQAWQAANDKARELGWIV
jgi:predicted nuclease of predicted toxin-antitoxin system